MYATKTCYLSEYYAWWDDEEIYKISLIFEYMMELTLGGFKTAKGLATTKICIANSQTFYLKNLQKVCKVPFLN